MSINPILLKLKPVNLDEVLEDVEVDGIDMDDYPDFCDAYISSAYFKDSGIELTDKEIDYINENYSDYVYACVEKRLY